MTSFQIISERLTLRPIQIQDAGAVFEYRSNGRVNQYQGWIPQVVSDVNDFIIHKVSPQIDLPGTWFQFVIVKNDTHELIGDVGVHFLSADDSQVELGCTLNEVHQGKGYATEALREVIRYVFDALGKRRIITSVDPRNLASIRLIERLGFRREAHFRESLFFNGEWVDDLVYALLKHETNILRE